MSSPTPQPLIFGGREFSAADLELIRQITSDFSGLGITEIARTACELLEWKRPNGGTRPHGPRSCGARGSRQRSLRVSAVPSRSAALAERRGAGVARAGGRGEPAVSVNLNLCESCLEKQRTIDRLKQENQSLREKVHRLERGVRDSASHGGPVPGRDGEADRGLSPGCGAACR